MYVALDRPEILYSTKTVASFMQSPTQSAMVKLKRLVRYLVGLPQAEWAYSKQVVPKYLDVHGDSDWAGDENARPPELPRSSEATLCRSRNRWSRYPARRRSSTPATAAPRVNCRRVISRPRRVTRWFRECGATAVLAVGSSAEQAEADSGTWRSDTCGHRSGCRKGSSC